MTAAVFVQPWQVIAVR